MAGTRLVAQLSFVFCILCIFIYSLYLLNIHHYFESHIHSYYIAHRTFDTLEENVYASSVYYSKLTTLRDLTTDEEEDSFWQDVASTVNSIDNDQSPPITELRVNLILASDNDNDAVNNTGDMQQDQKQEIMEMLAFSLEERLLSAQMLLPLIDIRILEYPHCGLNEAVQYVDIQPIPYFTLSKPRLLQLFNDREGFNIDYFLRTGLEPACVGSCQQVYVVMYRPKQSQQPVVVMTQNSKSDIHTSDILNSHKHAGLILNQQLVVMTLNDEDFAHSPTSTMCNVEEIASSIMSNFLKPFFFHHSDAVGSITSHVMTHHGAKRNCHRHSSNDIITKSELPLLLIIRIIHLQRSITQVVQQIVSLDTTADYYLHLQRDHPLFVLFTQAIHAQNHARTCLEATDSSTPHNAATTSMHANMTSLERLECAYSTLDSASQLAEKVLSSPERLSEVQEGYEFILALMVPYWFPILIPFIYGTAVEIRRYHNKVMSK